MDLTTPATLDGLEGDQLGEAEREAPRPVELTTHAGAVLNQAYTLLYRDVADCGPGIASALDDLAAALDAHAIATKVGAGVAAEMHRTLTTAAAELVDAVAVNATHRERVARRDEPRRLDPPGEDYPRDIFTVRPRHPFTERVAAFLGSVELMGEHLAALATAPAG